MLQKMKKSGKFKNQDELADEINKKFLKELVKDSKQINYEKVTKDYFEDKEVRNMIDVTK